MKPLTLLLSLIGLAVALSGWGYAWKARSTPQVAVKPDVIPFSGEEEMIFQLQEQIELLEEQNASLNEELQSLREK